MSAIYWARIDRVYFGTRLSDTSKIGFDDEFQYIDFKLPWEERKAIQVLSRFRTGICPQGLRGLAKQEGPAPLLTLRNDGSLADRRRIWENPEDDEADQRWHRDMLRWLATTWEKLT